MVQNYTVWVEKKHIRLWFLTNEKLSLPRSRESFVGLIHLEEYGGGSRKEERTEKSQTSELLRTRKTAGRKGSRGERRRMTSGMQEYLATPDAICPEHLERNCAPPNRSALDHRRNRPLLPSGNLPWKILPGCQRSRMSGPFIQEEREADQGLYDAEN